MSLRIRHLRLRAVTARGDFGADLAFGDGLFVLRADNSRGKSTAVKSMLFALGLERMITAQPTNAVTSAMRDRLIFDPLTKAETPVLASSVALEFENRSGAIVTATRWVKHEQFDVGLIQLEHGPALTDPGEYRIENLYVGRAGAASSAAGYQQWLARFIGWSMPLFPAKEGKLAPLYMEQVFPLLFVEQRRGWGGIQAQMPYFSGVTEVRRRSIEFLLNLDVGKYEQERQTLRARDAELQLEWRASVDAFQESLTGEGLVTLNVPKNLTVAWPPNPDPRVAASVGAGWIDLDDQIQNARQEVATLIGSVIPAITENSSALESRLADLAERSDSLRRTSAAIREDLVRHRTELSAVEDRIQALEDDLRKHRDAAILVRLGAPVLEELHEACPVCHQLLPDSLVALGPGPALSPDESVMYLSQQLDLFRVMKEDSARAMAAKGERLTANMREEADVRGQIRSVRTSLVGPNGSPSVEAIASRIRREAQLVRLVAIEERWFLFQSRLEALASSALEVRAKLADLPAERLSETDAAKLATLETSFIDQLRLYDFGSFLDANLMISRDDYHPRRDEFDLEADISASDSIRVIWAYLLGLMEVSSVHETNHPRLLLLDEPRQQSAKDVSFEALLRQAALVASRGGQVIFATSEDPRSLESKLEGVQHNLISIDGFLLKPLPS
ncbi:MAG: hypothetical protein F2681_14995 [Actinobacteria bacterium]|uniref:Unannotated protein n=1 Tax=freshwater metagenome TaxID=449393 RepID=A0A6J7AH78_9ZZZZ|nr:hypothetical protein [Actinomycetota bacterium]MSX93946.1 hypothetical protein [Actinomycetota bacterium]MSZ84440.1 hypothetical protein [Actinomycetota bacterium]MTB19446.1 hypothetical protein [Actinomycetota bacterium]